MKRLLAYTSLFLITLSSYSGVYSPESLPMSRVLSNETRVINPDNILSQDCCDAMDSLLLSLDSIGAYCVVAVCEHFEGDDPYEFAIGLGRKLEIGGKSSQGMVIALATLDRSYWISTGDGMEKFMTDAICRRIENRYMVPYLKQKDWNGAMFSTVQSVHGYLKQKPEYVEELSKNKTDDDDGSDAVGYFVLLGVASIAGFCYYSHRKEHTCPHCGKVKLKMIDRSKMKLSDSKERIKITYKCANCQELTYRDIIETLYTGSGGRGGFGGGSFGGGGGGFGGGGFGGLGGGSFSGGGAGGRF